jgi:hypothetical protein
MLEQALARLLLQKEMVQRQALQALLAEVGPAQPPLRPR